MATSVYQQGGYGTAALFPNPIIARRDPTSNDKVSPTGQPYQVFQGWNNELTDATFIYLGGGNWATLAAITGTVAQLTSNAGIALPAAGNINIVGGSGVTTSAAGSTLTISLTGGGTAIDSFVPDAGTNPVVPTALGAVTMAGTANQITTTGGVNTLTFSIPATFIAPGSIQATTTATAVSFITASATQGVTYSANTITATGSDADISISMVPKGTGAVAVTGPITATTSVTALSFITSSATLGTTYTANSVTPTGSDANISLLVNGKGTGGVVHSRSAAGVDINFQATNSDNTSGTSNASFQSAVGGTSAGDPYFQSLISGGQVFSWGIDNSTANDDWVLSKSATLGTANQLTIDGSTGLLTTVAGITANAGNITATNGNLILGTAGNKLQITTGANASAGTSTLVNGTVTVATTAVTASSIIILTRQTVGTTGANDLGILSVGTITPATSFVINAWTVTDATTLQADDQSVIGWVIIN